MNPVDKPRRPFGLGTYLLMVVGVGLIGGLIGGVGAAVGDIPGPLGLIVTMGAMAVSMAIAFAACVWWWRGIDEAAREAHKWAWWWGGTGGMAVGAVLLMTLNFRGEGVATADVDLGAMELIWGGASAILLFQLAGYGVAWAIWWLKHR